MANKQKTITFSYPSMAYKKKTAEKKHNLSIMKDSYSFELI